MKDIWQTVATNRWVEVDPQQAEAITISDSEFGTVVVMFYPGDSADVFLPYVDVRCPYPCRHPFTSWHGSRQECQDCGENVPESLSVSGDTMPDLPIQGWIWYDESDQIDTSTKENQS